MASLGRFDIERAGSFPISFDFSPLVPTLGGGNYKRVPAACRSTTISHRGSESHFGLAVCFPVELPFHGNNSCHTMFTGIVASTGKIARIQALDKGVRLDIEAASLDMDDVDVGDSIACDGVCLTVIECGEKSFSVEVSRETLDCTVGLGGHVSGGEINLEKALRLADRLGGHLVSGHVDGVGEVIKFERIGESHELLIRAPKPLARYIARKGSITVNGVSLTTNAVHDATDGAEFSINLIPHTVEVTTLKHLKPGSRVNLEIDLIARYVERMLEADQ